MFFVLAIILLKNFVKVFVFLVSFVNLINFEKVTFFRVNYF